MKLAALLGSLFSILFSVSAFAKTESRICEVNAVASAEAMYLQEAKDLMPHRYGITVTNYVIIKEKNKVDVDVEINGVNEKYDMWYAKYNFTFSTPNCRILEMGRLE